MNINFPILIREYISSQKKHLSPPVFVLKCMLYVINNNLTLDDLDNKPIQKVPTNDRTERAN